VAARREVEREYEVDSGRLFRETSGGGYGEPPLVGSIYEYNTDALAPWPAAVQQLEAVPGLGLVETGRTSWRYDAMGRPVHERRDDGTEVWSTYDRTGGPIRTRTGAGAESWVTTDGRGLPIRSARPFGRGETLRGYERDGRVLREVTTAG